MDDMISPKRAAKILDCERPHIYKLIRTGKLSSVKFGPRMVRISVSELERYRNEQCNRHGGSAGTGDSSARSPEAEMLDAALSSMKKTRKARRALSANSTEKRSA